MEAPENLYDLRKKNHPLYQEFRTLQVFECWVCGALTNKMYAGACVPIGYYEYTVCPHGGKGWHHELEKKLHWLDKPHPKDYQETLGRDIDEARKQCAKKVKNDLVGKPNLKLKKSVSHTFPNDLNVTCKHFWECSQW